MVGIIQSPISGSHMKKILLLSFAIFMPQITLLTANSNSNANSSSSDTKAKTLKIIVHGMIHGENIEQNSQAINSGIKN